MNPVNDQATQEHLIAVLRRLPWANELSEEAVIDLSKVGNYVQFQEGDVVHRADEKLTAIVFMVSGRLRITVLDLFGKEILDRPLIRGSVFGLLSMAHREHTNTGVVATEPSTVIRVGIEQLFELMAKHSDLQTNLYHLAGKLVRQIVMVDRTKSQPSVVGVVHHSAFTRSLTTRLVRRLAQIETTPCVASDDRNWQPIEGVPFQLLFKDGTFLPDQQRRAKLKEWAKYGRMFIDLDANHELDHLVLLMSTSDAIFWCIRPNGVGDAIEKLQALKSKVTGWRDKIHLVWLLDRETPIAPYLPEYSSFVERSFKISFSETARNQGNLLQLGLERIIHYLRGVQIGIALGGGAARGMAHLGVLKVLEANGIVVDMIAGTSAGAMTGTLYASGMNIDHTIDCFKNDLRLPWLFRHLPGGSYWYLLYKYRGKQFEPMLRKYLGDSRLEQLAIPMLTVTVDLVSADPVVRETGDATHGILESINLPGLSSPIIGNGTALVDGGLINNIPADVLARKGCNFVLASTVTAKLEQEFCGIRADQPTKKHGSPSFLKVIMRGQLVQSFNMNSVGVQPADFVIEPDVTAFDLSAFEQTDELAAVGERTTKEVIENIKQLLFKLDPKLFPLR